MPHHPKAEHWLSEKVYVTKSGKVYNLDYPSVWARLRKDGSLAFYCKLTDANSKQIDTRLELNEQTDELIDTWRKARKEFERRSNKDKHERTVRSNEKLGEFGLKEIERWDVSPQSRKKYLAWFAYTSGIHHLKVAEIQTWHIEEKILASLKKGTQRTKNGPLVPLSPSVQGNVIALLFRIFERARKQKPKIRHDNPVADLENVPKKSERVSKHVLLTARDSQRCRSISSPAGSKYVNFIAVLDMLGLRRGEALGLRWSSFTGIPWGEDLTGERIGNLRVKVEIAMQLHEETGLMTDELKSLASYREIPVSNLLVSYLLDQRRRVIDLYGSVVPLNFEHERVFPDLDHQGVENYIYRLGRRLGLVGPDRPNLKLTAHTFRHNWIVRLIQGSVDPELGLHVAEIAKLAGHTEATLMRDYLKVFESVKQGDGAAVAISRAMAVTG